VNHKEETPRKWVDLPEASAPAKQCHLKDVLRTWKKKTNIKKEMDGFVEKVDSSRSVHPMALLWRSCAEGWLFHLAP
jgi:hypothetical protein